MRNEQGYRDYLPVSLRFEISEGSSSKNIIGFKAPILPIDIGNIERAYNFVLCGGT